VCLLFACALAAACEFLLGDYTVREYPEGVRDIACRGRSTCAVLGSGEILCWGWNDYGQLGNGTNLGSAEPVAVVGLSSAAGSLAVGGAGGRHFCALLESGGIKCWGANDYGQLGDNTFDSRNTAVYVSGVISGVRALSAGSWHTCALLDEGAVRCWGRNDSGQLGDGTIEHSSVPGFVTGLGSGVYDIAAGGFHTCALLNSGGVTCWGSNIVGQLGGGATGLTSTVPAAVPSLPVGVASVSGGGQHTCALLNSGGVKCWGSNEFGQLGNGTTAGSMEPVDVTGLATEAAALSAGCNHTCILTAGRGVQCWGSNEFGQLGDGTTADSLEPHGVAGLDSGVFSLASGCTHTCALRSDGRIMCWGENLDGQLGDGTNVSRPSPVEVSFR
jgi:alpha-tubulin suppressor-like RCC1 family protein